MQTFDVYQVSKSVYMLDWFSCQTNKHANTQKQGRFIKVNCEYVFL